MRKLMMMVLATSALTACTMAPRYEQPVAPVAAEWLVDVMIAASAEGEQPAVTWQQMFTSPSMQQLIDMALANNRDLRVAVLNVQAARDTYRVQRAELVPNVDATGTATRQRTPENASSTGEDTLSSAYGVQVGVTAYEFDLFGRVRSESRAAFNQFLATEEARKTARISLIAEVANAYLAYLADRELLALTQETLASRKASYKVIQQSFGHGIGTQLMVAQAAAQVATAQANLAQYERQVAQDMNALTLLVGAEIPTDILTTDTLASVALMETLPVGLPSSVLLARPDVLQAEYVLKSKNANIGAARAAFFPSITLTGSAGLASTQLSNLFSAGSGVAWSFVPQITLPIFQGGSLLANLGLAKTNREIALAQYEQAVQSAFMEVADELVARATLTEQLTAQQELVAESKKANEIAQARYEAGVDDYLTALDAQRTLYSAQQSEIAVRQQRLANLVMLYKVLGGGAE